MARNTFARFSKWNDKKCALFQELDSIVNVAGSQDASLIQYIPSVEDYRLALPKALMQRYSIPFHLKGSNMSYDNKTQVLLFLERCENSIRTVTEKLFVEVFPEFAKQIENGIKIISGISEQGKEKLVHELKFTNIWN